MNKATINYWNNILLTIAFLITAFTGIMIKIFLPSGQRSGIKTLWGLSKHTWGTWHDWSGIVMVALTLVHLILYWDAMVCHTKNMFKKMKKQCKK